MACQGQTLLLIGPILNLQRKSSVVKTVPDLQDFLRNVNFLKQYFAELV
jgi:hypothetical protein